MKWWQRWRWCVYAICAYMCRFNIGENTLFFFCVSCISNTPYCVCNFPTKQKGAKKGLTHKKRHTPNDVCMRVFCVCVYWELLYRNRAKINWLEKSEKKNGNRGNHTHCTQCGRKKQTEKEEARREKNWKSTDTEIAVEIVWYDINAKEKEKRF